MGVAVRFSAPEGPRWKTGWFPFGREVQFIIISPIKIP